jgi:hypothetical protein
MDYLMIVTAARKALYVVRDNRDQLQIVRREKVATTTGTRSQHPHQKRQHLYLTLSGPHVR